MSQETVDAVVLRRWDVGESDRRLALLTRERGKLIAIARGARKAKSSLAGVSEPMIAGTYEIAFGRSSNYVTQAQSQYAFTHSRNDYTRLSCALAWLELLDAALHSGDSVPGAFDLCLVGLASVESAKSPHSSVAWGALKLLQLLGYTPVFARSVISGKPLEESVALSSSAGGSVLLSEAANLYDANQTDRAIAITFAKLQELDEPPAFVKRSADALACLCIFMEDHLGSRLAAMRSALQTD